MQVQGVVHLVRIGGSAVNLLLEDRLGFHGFKFSLEISDGMAVGAAVGSTARVGKVITIVLHFIAGAAPADGR